MTELLQLHIIRPINISFLVHYQKCSSVHLSAAVSAPAFQAFGIMFMKIISMPRTGRGEVFK